MMKLETADPKGEKTLKIVGACVAAVMFVGSTFLMKDHPAVAEFVVGLAAFVCGVVGVQIGSKT